jgi:hypothetical protein
VQPVEKIQLWLESAFYVETYIHLLLLWLLALPCLPSIVIDNHFIL